MALTNMEEVIKAQAAEIARLKTVPMKYRRMAFNAALQDEVAALQKSLAASQAREAELRRAIIQFRNEPSLCRLVKLRGTEGYAAISHAALDLPFDDSALHEYCSAEIQKLEWMRERGALE